MHNLRAAGIHFKLTCLHQEPAVFLPYSQSFARFLCSMVRFSCKPAVSLPYCQSFVVFFCSTVQKFGNHAIFLFCWLLLQCSEKINFSVFFVFSFCWFSLMTSRVTYDANCLINRCLFVARSRLHNFRFVCGKQKINIERMFFFF